MNTEVNGINALEVRLKKLEKRYWQFRNISVFFGVILIALFILSFFHSPDIIEATELRIRDSQGEIRAGIYIYEDLVILELLSATHKSQVIISAGDMGSTVELHSPLDSLQVAMMASPSISGLMLFDDGSNMIGMLGKVPEFGWGLNLMRPDATTGISLGIMKKGSEYYPVSSLRDENNDQRIFMTVREEGPFMMLFEEDGKVIPGFDPASWGR